MCERFQVRDLGDIQKLVDTTPEELADDNLMHECFRASAGRGGTRHGRGRAGRQIDIRNLEKGF